MRALVLVVLAGCYFQSKQAGTTRTVLDTRTGSDIPSNVTGQIGIRIAGANQTVAVRSLFERRCYRQLIDVVEVRTRYERSFQIADIDGDSWGVLFIVLLAPITIPISAAITPRDDEVHRELQRTRVEAFECPLIAPNVSVTLALPSGARLEATTNEHGSAVFTIPSTEPPCGEVRAHSKNVASPKFRYGSC